MRITNDDGRIDEFTTYVVNDRAAESPRAHADLEPIPSAGWREIAAALHVSPGLGARDEQRRADDPDVDAAVPGGARW